MILPVHFGLLDGRVVIHAKPDTTLYRATDATVVAFEADGPVGASEPTWSVVVHGIARHVEPWDRFERPSACRIEILIDQVTGREVLGDTPPMAPPCPAARSRC